MRIISNERRGRGQAYAGLVFIAFRDEPFTLLLERHPYGARLWQTALFQTPARITPDAYEHPLWQSQCRVAATLAIDELLEHIAHLGLPDDLYPLVTALLPDQPIAAPLCEEMQGDTMVLVYCR